MEEQQKKRSNDFKRGRQQPKSSTLSLPLDLTSEILLRLPEKSIVRFRCVSKLWSSIITDPYFINLFEIRYPRPSLLVYFRKDDKLFVSSIPQHTKTNKSFSFSQPIEFTGAYSPYPPTESVHGLICFQESGNPVVWNPSKKQFLILPKPRKNWNNLTVFLGYDPVEGKHKVMCIPLKRSTDVCRVLTLRSSAQESWRTVKTNHKHRSYLHTTGRCINGVIYYVAYIYHTHVWVIMSFDVRFEKFDMIELPTNMNTYRDILITYGRRLACVDIYNGSRLWILEDARKHKWSSQDFLSPLRGYVNGTINVKLAGFTHAGEFIFRPYVFSKSSYVLFYDPERNSFRRLEFKELAVHDESLLNNGVEYTLYALPNHIESQISLL